MPTSSFSAGVQFFDAVTVVDSEDAAKVYSFDLSPDQASSGHAACFNIGVGPDGTPLISWSDLHVLYQLPDGSKWAEHGHLHDAEDLVRMFCKHAISYVCMHSWGLC